MNEETQKSQQFALCLTKWVFDQFGVKLLKQMPKKEVDTKLMELSALLKESETKKRATEVVQRSAHKPRSGAEKALLYEKVPTFGGRDVNARLTITQPHEIYDGREQAADSSFFHIDKRSHKGVKNLDNGGSSGSENVCEDSFAKPSQIDLFQQGAARKEYNLQDKDSYDCAEKSAVKSEAKAKPSKNSRRGGCSSNARNTPMNRSVSPFSQMRSDMAVSNGLSNHGKGTTFCFDD